MLNYANLNYLIAGSCFGEFGDIASHVDAALKFYGGHVDLERVAKGHSAAKDRSGYSHLGLSIGDDGKCGAPFLINDLGDPGDYPRNPLLIIGATKLCGRPTGFILSVKDVLGTGDVRGKHLVYAHSISATSDIGVLGTPGSMSYVGITRRGIATRWRDHLARVRAGSTYRFHAALRELGGEVFLTHHVIACGLTEPEAMNIEECAVRQWSFGKRGLNMIPGGYAGIQFLAQLGRSTSRNGWENREHHIADILRSSVRRGHPNPLAALLWKSDDFYENVVFNNQNNFSREDVVSIREMANSGLEAASIAARIRCREARVADLLSGRTFSRLN